MSYSSMSLDVSSDHSLRIDPQGGSAVVTVNSGGQVLYGQTSQVQSGFSDGVIAVNGSQAFTSPTWIVGSSSVMSAVTVITTISPVGVGPAGPPGAAGSGGLGIEVWGSQSNPASVTDWGPIINGLSANGRRLNFAAPHDYPFSTQINWTNFISATLQGENGLVWTEGVTTQHGGARLVWKGGAGSGTAINLNITNGCKIADLSVVYDNAAYDGNLITVSAISAFGQIVRCYIGSADQVMNNARSLINLDGAVGAIVDSCSLIGGKDLIRGFETNAVSNDIVIRKNQLQNGALSALKNVGLNWCIEDNTFEFNNAAAPNMNGIDSDITCTSRFWAYNNTFWDYYAQGQLAINQRAANTMVATIIGGYCDIQSTGTYFKLNGPGAFTICDVTFDANTSAQTCIDMGSSGTALKRIMRVSGCDFALSTNPIVNITGHDQTTLEMNGSSSGGGYGPQLRTIGGYERVGNGHTLPSVVVHSGTPAGWTLQSIQGNDMAGLITASNGGTIVPAGKVLDLTFATPMLPAKRSQSSQTWLSVLVSGAEIAGWSSGAASAACGPYASVFNSTTDASITSTGFSIGIANPIPASAVVTFAYRVIQL